MCATDSRRDLSGVDLSGDGKGQKALVSVVLAVERGCVLKRGEKQRTREFFLRGKWGGVLCEESI